MSLEERSAATPDAQAERTEFVDVPAGLYLFLKQTEDLKIDGVALAQHRTSRLKDEILSLRQVKAMTLKQVGELLSSAAQGDVMHSDSIKARLKHSMMLLNRDAEYYRNLRLMVCPASLKQQLILESTRCRLQNEICLMMTAMHLLRVSKPEDLRVDQPLAFRENLTCKAGGCDTVLSVAAARTGKRNAEHT